jgi:LytS/YehU family sensor histidine kinase
VSGGLAWDRVALGGALSGPWLRLFVGLIVALFTTQNPLAVILSTAMFGAVFGLVWALIGYAAARGRRDFTSVTQVVATRFEVMVEHTHAERGRELLAQLRP